MSLPDITLALFSLFNILRLGSYFPQIIRVAADDEGAKAISYSTWCIWIGANASTAIYAAVNVMDAALFLVSAFNTAGCAAVVGLTAFKRFHFRQSQRLAFGIEGRSAAWPRSRGGATKGDMSCPPRFSMATPSMTAAITAPIRCLTSNATRRRAHRSSRTLLARTPCNSASPSGP
jgi:hypothetical protein